MARSELRSIRQAPRPAGVLQILEEEEIRGLRRHGTFSRRELKKSCPNVAAPSTAKLPAMCSWQIRTQVVVAPRRRLAHSTALIDCCGPQSSAGRHRRCRHRLPWSRSPAWRMHPAPTSRAGSAATGRRQSPRRPGLRSCPPRAAVVPRPDVGAQKSCSACQNRAPTTVTERQGRVSSRRRVSVVPNLGDPRGV
jgi:hypothetical protein